MRRRWRLAAAVAALVVAAVAVLVWQLWPSQSAPVPRARQYRDVDVCLLTDVQGVAGEAARPVWLGMQDASVATRARVQFLAVMGPATKENALPYLASLVQRRCVLVFAVGPAQTAAVAAGAATFAKVRFAVVGADAVGANVTRVEAVSADAVRSAVRDLTTAEVRKSPAG